MKYLFKEFNNLKLGILIITIISIILSILLIKIESYTKSLLTIQIIPFLILFTTISISMLSAFNEKSKNNDVSSNSKKKFIVSRYIVYIIFIIVGIILSVFISSIFLKFLNILDTNAKEQIANCIAYSTIISFILRSFLHTL